MLLVKDLIPDLEKVDRTEKFLHVEAAPVPDTEAMRRAWNGLAQSQLQNQMAALQNQGLGSLGGLLGGSLPQGSVQW